MVKLQFPVLGWMPLSYEAGILQGRVFWSPHRSPPPKTHWATAAVAGAVRHTRRPLVVVRDSTLPPGPLIGSCGDLGDFDVTVLGRMPLGGHLWEQLDKGVCDR